MRRGRLRGDKAQLEVADDPVHHGIIGEESRGRWRRVRSTGQ